MICLWFIYDLFMSFFMICVWFLGFPLFLIDFPKEVLEIFDFPFAFLRIFLEILDVFLFFIYFFEFSLGISLKKIKNTNKS